MKKLVLIVLMTVFAMGCMQYRYTPRIERKARIDHSVKRGPKKQVGPNKFERETIHTRKYSSRRWRQGEDVKLEEGFIDIDLDVLGATDLVSIAMGFHPPESYVDFAVGIGLGFQTIGFVRSRLFLRDRASSPYLFAGYWHAFETEAIEFESDDSLDVTEYKIGGADVLGYGFGFQWFIEDGTLFHVQVGYHNRVHGGHLKYISGDLPDDAPDLFDDVQSLVAGDSLTLSAGLEFRF